MATDYDFMKIALEEAESGYRRGEVPVGAVLVREGNILAQAHNSPISTNDPSAHAEMLVLRKAGEILGNYRLSGTELYVTIIHARVERVIFGARDPKFGAVVSLYNILDDKRLNHQVKVTEGVLKEECGEIISRFFREKRVTSAPASAK